MRHWMTRTTEEETCERTDNCENDGLRERGGMRK